MATSKSRKSSKDSLKSPRLPPMTAAEFERSPEDKKVDREALAKINRKRAQPK